MVHDEFCELKRMAGTTCHCAQRAYEKDPIEGVPNPYNDSKITTSEINPLQNYYDELWLRQLEYHVQMHIEYGNGSE